MLESISWQEFFKTIAILLGGYYAISMLLLFSSEITNFFNSKQQGVSEGGQPHSESQPSLMGGVRIERSAQQEFLREEVSNSDELQIASQEYEEPINSVDLAAERLQNDFYSISAEIQSLVEIASQSTKEESGALFKTLLSNYPQFIGTPFQQQVNELISDSCKEVSGHPFDLMEVNSWWTNGEAN